MKMYTALESAWLPQEAAHNAAIYGRDALYYISIGGCNSANAAYAAARLAFRWAARYLAA